MIMLSKLSKSIHDDDCKDFKIP